MRHLLLGGIPAGVAGWLEESLPGLQTEVTGDLGETRVALSKRHWDLVILDESLGWEGLLELTSSPKRPDIVVSLESVKDAQKMEELVHRRGVRQLFIHPLEAEHLLSDLAVLLALDRKSPSPSEDPLSIIWNRNLDLQLSRVTGVETAIAAMLEGRAEEEVRRTGEREAHKLAGSLGTFRLAQGSRLARELEEFLNRAGRVSPDPDDIHHATRLVNGLRKTVLAGPPQAEALHPQRGLPETTRRILILGENPVDLGREAAQRNLRVQVYGDQEEARSRLAQGGITAAVVEVDSREGRELLYDLTNQQPDLPVVAVLSRGGLTSRVEAVGLGAVAVVEKTLPVSLLLDEVETALRLRQWPQPTLLAVDDDPALLESLEGLLGARFNFHSLSEPLAFWETLHQVEPDVLLLDVEMPGLSGIDLCRVVRRSTRWRQLPVLFLTSALDSEVVHRLFAAGADDYVAKPVAGPELLARIANRLERNRILQRSSMVDPATGVASGRSAPGVLARFLGLARRVGAPVCLALLHLQGPMPDGDLARTGQVLLKFLRQHDHVSRWGRREFLLGMFGIDRPTATRRLQQLLAELSSEDGRVSIVAALVEAPGDGQSLDELLDAARGLVAQPTPLEGTRLVTVDQVVPAHSSADGARIVDVLLVEDDAVLAPLVLHSLKSHQYSCTWIRDGRQALDALVGPRALWRPRLILLDVDLPGMSGLRLLRRLKQERVLGGVKVIMITVRASEREVLQTLGIGASDHISKPFSLSILLERVRHVLGS